jgi:hypothetical protein
MVEWNEHHSRTQAQRPGARRSGSGDYRRTAEGVARIVMFAEPGGIEAQFFKKLDLLQDLTVIAAGRFVDLRVIIDVIEDSEFHIASLRRETQAL